MNYLWLLFEPLLFGLIGAEVLLDDVELSALGESPACSVVNCQRNHPVVGKKVGVK